ncbi:MAG: hypothetical protein IJY24_05925 [Clostridia bacterium]|nr:hypothetical protein [Clostridia bacterium]
MKILKIVGKIALITLCAILALVLLVWGGLNIAKFIIYGEYYSIKADICINPGLNDGFVCQGVAVSEENETIIVAGYMTDKSNSRIYITNEKNEDRFVYLTRGGEKYTGHAGGVAITGSNVYLANGSKIYTFPLSELLNAENGDTVDIGEGTKVNNNASFVFTNEEYLYVGEFSDTANGYDTDHKIETSDGEYLAIITRYAINDLSTPTKIYAVRDYVQGVCFTPDGQVVLSTSYGLNDSTYYVYDEAEATDSGEMLDGAPVYHLTSPSRIVKGPAMSEDMDWYNGRVITLSESASNKYIYGKFFFANKIVGLDFSE